MGGYPLKGKRVLVTAGPTWAAVDDVRVISNISSGEMGLALVERALSFGGRVDLLLGPVGNITSPPCARVLRFFYFDELRQLLKRLLGAKRYDIIFHAAAVSDYIPRRVRGKISSKNASLILKLSSAPKLIDLIRRMSPKARLVMFKLEMDVSDRELLRRSRQALRRAGADFVVGNTLRKTAYRGYLLDKKAVLAKADSRQEMVKALMKTVCVEREI